MHCRKLSTIWSSDVEQFNHEGRRPNCYASEQLFYDKHATSKSISILTCFSLKKKLISRTEQNIYFDLSIYSLSAIVKYNIIQSHANENGKIN